MGLPLFSEKLGSSLLCSFSSATSISNLAKHPLCTSRRVSLSKTRSSISKGLSRFSKEFVRSVEKNLLQILKFQDASEHWQISYWCSEEN